MARILCYTDKCFSVYAKSDKFKILFYQRDENVGKVYVQTQQYSHSPTIPGSQPLLKSLTDAVYGQVIGGGNGGGQLQQRSSKDHDDQ